MRFRKKTLGQMTVRIVELGLSKCPICGTGVITASRLPALVPIGGIHREKDDPRHDPEANVLFAVVLTCNLCGYMLLFDSEKFTPGDEKTMIFGPPEREDEIEAALEAEEEPPTGG
jgi:hypothetical protein